MDDFPDSRYAHEPGYTEICFDETGTHFVTGGAEGDIRIWKGFDDENPESHNMGKTVTAIAFRNKMLYIATDNFSVSAYKFPDVAFESIIAQYTSTVHHIACSADGNLVASGGSDFVIKAYDVSSKDLLAFYGHEGSILSLTFDGKGRYLASSACDGTVRIWKLSDQECVKTLNAFKKSNEWVLSSLRKISWSPEGQYIAVPVDKEIYFYLRDNWELSFSLKNELIDQDTSIIAFSPFGNYITAATANGLLVVWDVDKRQCISKKYHERKIPITSCLWNPSGKDIVFCDSEGYLSVFENPIAVGMKQESLEAVKVDIRDIPIDFECDDDEKDDDEANDLDRIYDNEDFDNENAFDIGAIKATLEPKIFGTNSEADNASVKSESETKVHVIEAPKPVIQTSFQPSSTPINLEHRFMLWNSVGIVRCYNTEEENSIDVEFHDTNIYHPLHVNNTRNHTLAALSIEGLLLAGPKGNENYSLLECLNFGTWDANKEWIMPMPENEEIVSIAISENYAVCITDRRLLRIFTISGIQYEVLSIPGPVVCSAANGQQILVSYHKGLGIENDQCLNLMIIDVKLGRECVIRDYPLPLSPKSFLAWLGFSDEGHPCAVDTTGIVNLLSPSFGMKWTPIANTRTNLRGLSDTYFVIGLSEIRQEIRCILCKGAKYPSLLPKPTVAVVPFCLLFCEMLSDKGRLEEENRRCSMIHKRLENLLKEGYDVDQEYKDLEKKWMDTLITMFALATKSDKEQRAYNIAELMPNTAVLQGAIKYATQRHRTALAERVGEIINMKILGEEDEVLDPIAECEAINMSHDSICPQSLRLKATENDVILKPKPLFKGRLDSSRSASSEQISSESTSYLDHLEIPVEKSSPVTSNPFRASFKTKSVQKIENSPSDIDAVLDNSMKKLNDRQNSVSSPTSRFAKKKSQESKNTMHQESKSNSQTKLNVFPQESEQKRFGFQLFLEEKRELIACSSETEMNETEIVRTAMKMYKELTPEQKQKYAQQSKKECLTNITNGVISENGNTEDSESTENHSEDLASNNENTPKRKESLDTEDVPKAKKPKTSSSKIANTSSRKLTQFAFTRRPKQTE